MKFSIIIPVYNEIYWLRQFWANLKKARDAEIALRKTRQALEEEKSAWELEKQKALDAERTLIQEKTRKAAEEEFRLKLAEKDQVLQAMKKTVDDLKRKADQGSQQLQGEVLELDLEESLKAAFPRDIIEPVGKGVRGGDVLQRVVGPQGKVAGTILWESKRTKAWSDKWLDKLRDDQREAKAQIAALVTSTLPKPIETFEEKEGVSGEGERGSNTVPAGGRSGRSHRRSAVPRSAGNPLSVVSGRAWGRWAVSSRHKLGDRVAPE